MKRTIIITAGGIGKRMGSELPKQFMELKGLPVLMHTIQKFYTFEPTIQIIVTLPEDWISFWHELQAKNNFIIPHEIVSGGNERYDSIKNAIQRANGEVIGVHDGSRPCVSTATIEKAFLAAEKYGSGVPCLQMAESIREVKGESSQARNRSNYRIIQTPQCFSRELITKAYLQPFHAGITDDASLVEESGHAITLTEGNPENIKITYLQDLKIAELFI